jgi:hypothetical protein
MDAEAYGALADTELDATALYNAEKAKLDNKETKA